jgi:protein-S-isoprenylcysteine O-methyltransferase Ste14
MMDARSTALIRRAWPRQLIFLLVLTMLLFAPAGTLRYWQAWLFVFVFVTGTVGIGFYFLLHDPALVERRMAAGPKAEQEPTQKIIMALMVAGFLLLAVIPGFDHRWHWSAVPPWLVVLAELGIVASFVIFFVVMKQNSYAASTVQVEADQPVISSGLYSVVRHPMYAGALLLTNSMPLALGSFWSLLLAILLLPVLAWRLLDEERFLLSHLPGYSEYCRKVRYRLIPRVW